MSVSAHISGELCSPEVCAFFCFNEKDERMTPAYYENAASEAEDNVSAPATVEEQPSDPFSGFQQRSQQISERVEDGSVERESAPDAPPDHATEDEQPETASAEGDITEEDVIAALRQPVSTDQSSLQALQETVNQLLEYVRNGAPLPKQDAEQQAIVPLTPEEYDQIFDSETGPAVLQGYISKQIQAVLAKQVQQQVLPTIDRQFVYRDFFAKNSDINPEAESTLIAAEMINARHPNVSETEKLRLMGELIRQTRDSVRAIKKTHNARISRTPAPARTGARDSRPKSALTAEEQAMLDVRERMNRVFMGDRQ